MECAFITRSHKDNWASFFLQWRSLVKKPCTGLKSNERVTLVVSETVDCKDNDLVKFYCDQRLSFFLKVDFVGSSWSTMYTELCRLTQQQAVLIKIFLTKHLTKGLVNFLENLATFLTKESPVLPLEQRIRRLVAGKPLYSSHSTDRMAAA